MGRPPLSLGRPRWTSPAQRLTLAAFRAPVRVYYAGWGWLFGRRLLMIEHQGRKTGLPRATVLEVVDQTADGTFVVAGAFGDTADWYRNICANGQIDVVVGRSRFPASARRLSQTESLLQLDAYLRRHAWWGPLLPWLFNRITDWPYDESASANRRLADAMVFVELTRLDSH